MCNACPRDREPSYNTDSDQVASRVGALFALGARHFFVVRHDAALSDNVALELALWISVELSQRLSVLPDALGADLSFADRVAQRLCERDAQRLAVALAVRIDHRDAVQEPVALADCDGARANALAVAVKDLDDLAVAHTLPGRLGVVARDRSRDIDCRSFSDSLCEHFVGADKRRNSFERADRLGVCIVERVAFSEPNGCCFALSVRLAHPDRVEQQHTLAECDKVNVCIRVCVSVGYCNSVCRNHYPKCLAHDYAEPAHDSHELRLSHKLALRVTHTDLNNFSHVERLGAPDRVADKLAHADGHRLACDDDPHRLGQAADNNNLCHGVCDAVKVTLGESYHTEHGQREPVAHLYPYNLGLV